MCYVNYRKISQSLCLCGTQQQGFLTQKIPLKGSLVFLVLFQLLDSAVNQTYSFQSVTELSVMQSYCNDSSAGLIK